MDKIPKAFNREEALHLIKKTRDHMSKETEAIRVIYESSYTDTITLPKIFLLFSGALSDGALLLLIHLLSISEEKECKEGFYAPIARLAKDLGVCEVTLWRRFKELIEKEILSKPKRHHKKDQLGVFNTYKIRNLDRWWERFGKRYKKLVLEKRNLQWIKGLKATKIKKPTYPERLFDSITSDIVQYVGNGTWWKKLSDGKNHNPDFKITGQNKVIEIFGDWWHRRENPQELIDLYKQVGLECLVFWEHEVYNNQEETLEKVNQFINKKEE